MKCYVPTHSLVNYSQWQIVSPEASLASLPCVDGYRDLCNKKEQVNLFCNDLETIKKIIKKDGTPHSHPFQRMWIRTSTEFYFRFILDMDRSPGFGSACADFTPI